MKKIAFVTGSSKGIGRAIAIKLAKDGYGIILHAPNLSSELKIAEKEVKNAGKLIYTAIFDISSEQEVKTSCKLLLNKQSKIDILVNNAGVSKDSTFQKMSSKQWDEVIKTNLYGPFFVTKQFLPKMIENRFGRIINVSSIAVRGAFGKTNYSASKSGLIGFTRSLALEVAKDNITVNAICPGYINTGLSSLITTKYQKKIISQIAMRRGGEADEVADLVSFLASPKSTYITGAVVDINGGWL